MRSDIYVIFGIGKAGQELLKIFPRPVKYIVDNNPDKWGTVYNGVEVYSPEKLLEEDKEDLHIFIASMYFGQIKNQLDNMGFREEEHYINACLYYDVFRNFSSLLDILGLFAKESYKTFAINNNFIKFERKLLFITNKNNYKSETARFIKKYLVEFFKIKIVECTENTFSKNNIVLLRNEYKKLGYSKVLYWGTNIEIIEFIKEHFENYYILDSEVQINDKTQYVDALYSILNQLGFDFKKVSVIVPNYNYGIYLERRIKSIIEQQYPIYEILFLDDASKDDSTIIAECLLNDNLGLTQFLINKTNSGSAFKQWAKGIEAAHGNYIWMAEADDYASLYMLNNLIVPFSEDADIALSYCDSMVVDEKGNWQTNYSQINAQFAPRYLDDGIYDAKYFIENYLTKSNSIPNASAVLMNKSKIKPEFLEWIQEFKGCGDWYFYILLLTDGKIAYNSMPMNFFRRHSQSVTLNSSSLRNELELKKIRELIDAVCNENT